MIPPSGDQHEVTFAGRRAVVVQVGGGLRVYATGDRDILDGYAAGEVCRSGRGQVLAPWPNRIEDGAYTFDGTEYRLALTEPEHGNAIHRTGEDVIRLEPGETFSGTWGIEVA